MTKVQSVQAKTANDAETIIELIVQSEFVDVVSMTESSKGFRIFFSYDQRFADKAFIQRLEVLAKFGEHLSIRSLFNKGTNTNDETRTKV